MHILLDHNETALSSASCKMDYVVVEFKQSVIFQFARKLIVRHLSFFFNCFNSSLYDVNE